MQMGFGYQSPEMKIPLFNFAEQFAAILAAIPGEIISEESRARAISALFDFSYADVGKVRQTSKAVKVTDPTAKKKEEESGQAFGKFLHFPLLGSRGSYEHFSEPLQGQPSPKS